MPGIVGVRIECVAGLVRNVVTFVVFEYRVQVGHTAPCVLIKTIYKHVKEVQKSEQPEEDIDPRFVVLPPETP